jgi:hypothetical protein
MKLTNYFCTRLVLTSLIRNQGSQTDPNPASVSIHENCTYSGWSRGIWKRSRVFPFKHCRGGYVQFTQEIETKLFQRGSFFNIGSRHSKRLLLIWLSFSYVITCWKLSAFVICLLNRQSTVGRVRELWELGLEFSQIHIGSGGQVTFNRYLSYVTYITCKSDSLLKIRYPFSL